MFLTRELHDILRALAIAGAEMPPSQFRDGYSAALVAMGAAVGIGGDVSNVTRASAAQRRAGDGFDGPGWIGAFARMG
jgi:hypothetical protein